MNTMPCGLEDDRVRYESDSDEDINLMTEMERRISWLCDDWLDAIERDTYEAWHDVRMQLHGATQTLIYCKDRNEDYKAINDLSKMAFENGLDCIQRGNYEG